MLIRRPIPRRLAHSTHPLKFSLWWPISTVVSNESVMTTTDSIRGGATMIEGDILTVPEVARLLRVPKSTVYKLARLGQLPASKIGKHWRFVRRDLEAWVHRLGPAH